MPVRHLVVLDPDQSPCPVETCGRLAPVLRELLPAGEITIEAVSRVTDARGHPDLVLLRSATRPEGREALRIIRQRWGAVLLLGFACTDGVGRRAHPSPLLHELDDFLSCPFGRSELQLRILRLLHGGAAARPLPRAEREVELPALPFVGESRAFRRVLAAIPGIAPCDATILITGETGTGKEMAARTIHYGSPRRSRPFVPVNCGALPDHLFENEMFGHARGAFTDASSAQKGLVSEAESGSLFLDEIDTLSAQAQVKLLRLLQGGEYRPLGSSRAQVADVRIITATNADLRQKVEAGEFREDLYYRLNILRLALPPLRERVEDIPLLAEHFLARYGILYRRERMCLSDGALRKLLAHHWPGNVRELESTLQRAVIVTEGPVLDPDDIDLPSITSAFPVPERGPAGGLFQDAKARAIEQFERAYLVELLATHEGNVTRAARRAGKERRAFQRLMRKHGLGREPSRS
ncbi:MAG TPA: sigma-54 dependent transcriptional regulator [Longimicrobiaceae bacterium]|nr:sigma-54 dependent transcriptional regulator [Longimicrobiaceae bacterium]